jgi:hypothetical protein
MTELGRKSGIFICAILRENPRIIPGLFEIRNSVEYKIP